MIDHDLQGLAKNVLPDDIFCIFHQVNEAQNNGFVGNGANLLI